MNHRLMLAVCGLAIGLELGGCSGKSTLQDLLGPSGLSSTPATVAAAPAQSTPPVAGSSAAGSPAAGSPAAELSVKKQGEQITSFRTPFVTLYTSSGGQEAQRVPASTLQTPLTIVGSSASVGRVQIATLDGNRWVAVSDVVLAARP